MDKNTKNNKEKMLEYLYEERQKMLMANPHGIKVDDYMTFEAMNDQIGRLRMELRDQHWKEVYDKLGVKSDENAI